MNILKAVRGAWFTGLLIIVAGIGYLFYVLLIGIRILQMKKLYTAILVLILCGTVAFIGGALYLLIPYKHIGKEIELILEPGTKVKSFVDTLKGRKVIPNTTLFLLWLKMTKYDRSIQAGRYLFYENDGIFKAAKRLHEVHAIECMVTVPEGLTVEQTAAKLAGIIKLEIDQFVRLCYDRQFIAALGLDEPSLEGYLFPETYRFRKNVLERDIITSMVKRFEKEYEAIPLSPVSEKMTRREIVILASIVEKETALDSERSRIAGVFLNRLRMRIPLGADPTVRYVLRKFSGQLRVSELKDPNPYNTRVHAGLPPGAICSPGRESIKAVVHPMDTKELYFVAKWDGSGAHEFSKTNAEHDRKKEVIKRMNELRIRRQADSIAQANTFN